jgi:peptidyl-prolyl cis-trans isomerase SurA
LGGIKPKHSRLSFNAVARHNFYNTQHIQAFTLKATKHINPIKTLMRFFILAVIFFGIAPAVSAQQIDTIKMDGRIVDEIIAIVGDNYILKSDIDKEFATLEEQAGIEFEASDRYQILNSLIAKKIVLYKAQLDSIEIAPERIDGEIERRMAYILSQFPGGEDDFVKYLGKSIEEFKAQTREKLFEEMLINEMQQKILKDVKITPTEIRHYYNSIPHDSLPHIDAEVTLAQIVRKPKVTDLEKEYARKKIEDLREELMNGADFEILAQVNSMDPGSASRGGELGFFGRGQMVPEFEAMAFKLKPDTISKIIETQFGYHIMKLIERRGEKVNVRHILISPQTLPVDMQMAKGVLDTLLASINANRITFEDAAKRYSDDEQTASNGGKMSDRLGNFTVTIDQLDKDAFSAVNKMKAGEIYGPVFCKGEEKLGTKDCYKLYYLEAETEPHIASLEQDWVKVQNAALEAKKAETLEKWVIKHKKEFYIKLIDKYAQHPLLQHWVAKN